MLGFHHDSFPIFSSRFFLFFFFNNEIAHKRLGCYFSFERFLSSNSSFRDHSFTSPSCSPLTVDSARQCVCLSFFSFICSSPQSSRIPICGSCFSDLLGTRIFISPLLNLPLLLHKRFVIFEKGLYRKEKEGNQLGIYITSFFFFFFSKWLFC